MAYKRLLVAIDLGVASDKIAIKAATMARTQQAEIHILHIVEPLSLTYGADLHVDTSSLQEEINEQAAEEAAEAIAIKENQAIQYQLNKVYAVRQNKKISGRQINYLDHPKMGVIVSIKKYILPEID